MNDDVRDIAAYYDANVQREHERLERHQLELDLTWRYFGRYLPAGGRILEVGAATGRYTLELARRGYQVTAVDFSAEELRANQELLQAAGLARQVEYVIADGRDLSQVRGRDFDAALLMGPLYHLILEADRKRSLGQVYERLKPGGLLFSAHITRLGVLADLMKKDSGWIENQAEAGSLVENGHRPDDAPLGGWRGYFVRPEEVEPLHAACGFERVALAAVEPLIAADDECYNSLEGKQRALWLEMLERVSQEPSILGVSRHLLYIGRKQ
jgi:S-adenosylmethionine-dependent methyltransferase